MTTKPTVFEWIERDRIPEFKIAAALGNPAAAAQAAFYRRLLTTVYIGTSAPNYLEACPGLSYWDFAHDKWGNA